MDNTTEALTSRLASTPIPPELQPVVSFLTHALTLQGSRISKLRDQVASLSKLTEEQSESLAQIAQADERAQRAEEAASSLVVATTARAHHAEAAVASLEQRMAHLEQLLHRPRASSDACSEADGRVGNEVGHDRIESLELEMRAMVRRQQSAAVQFSSLSDLLQSTREWVTALQTDSEAQNKARREHQDLIGRMRSETSELHQQHAALAQACAQEQSQLYHLRREFHQEMESQAAP